MKPPIILRVFHQSQLIEIKQFQLSQVTIGNEGEVDVTLHHPEVSPVHAVIEERESGYFLCDLGSSTGTFKNNQPVLDVAISSGDQIRIGPYEIHFFIGIPKPRAAPVAKIPISGSGISPEPKENLVIANVNGESSVSSSPRSPVETVTSVPVVPSIPAGIPSVRVLSSQPEIRTYSDVLDAVYGKRKKGQKTFAPPGAEKNLFNYVKPANGPVLEILVAWHERIISSQHFDKATQVSMGSSEKATVFVPGNFCRPMSPLADVGAKVRVYVQAGVEYEVKNPQGLLGPDKLVAPKVTVGATARIITLEQGEVLILKLEGGIIQLVLRFVAKTPVPATVGFLDMSAGELGAVLMSALISGLLAFYFSVMSPPEAEVGENKEEKTERIAQFIYEKKPVPPPPLPVEKKIEVKEAKAEEKKPVEKALVDSPKKQAAPTKAAEVAKGRTDRPKKFTGTQPQGGAVKMGAQTGANAQTQQVNVNDTGLLSAFGTGGLRSKLDKASSGTGDLLGAATGAKGKSGFGENRPGQDLGGQFKDVGAGGKGLATAGIAGVNTKGRSSGQSEYGKTGDLGGKGQVSIEPSGQEADFAGTIDKEAVRRVIRFHLAEVRSCYERALNKKSSIEGKLSVKFEIVSKGRVRSASVSSSTIGDKSVEDCIVNRLRSWEFPEPPEGTVATVNFPFVLNAQR